MAHTSKDDKSFDILRNCTLCDKLQMVFARFGIPERVVSDNGPPFNSAEYTLFAIELLMGRKLRTTVPIFHTLLHPKCVDVQKLQQKEDASKLKQKQYFDSKHLAKPLQPLSPRTEVQISTHHEPGVIRQETENTRQYEVETPTETIKRNRVQLVPLPPEKETGIKTKEHANPELNIHSRPKRTIKVSLKARESRHVV
ncbi:Transposon Ty3-G Gag-Pol poly [Paramuricea clavata]|uniref:Transposon Ty3-G Gag-Pol poly n=1 Tax=Paramuricea clavata TaxID=317549 RepID=A0A6S7HMG2_PARCT|nr:Transposon Ty3-G Gag-Pol poly [Paramuricea clavata]